MNSDSIMTPFRFRELGDRLLITNEVGDRGFFDNDVLDRLFAEELEPDEEARLRELSILTDEQTQWRLYSLLHRSRQSRASKRQIKYIIVVPTLRCNLSCSYCQVSRAPLHAKGFDWDESKLIDFERFVAGLDLDHLKLEFQGGEPSLRPDLLGAIIEIIRRHSTSCEFVVCTNLSEVTPEFASLIERNDLFVSTSIDGSQQTMTANRTFDDALSKKTLENFEWVKGTFGSDKIAALPTITEAQIGNPAEVISVYRELGFSSIFLRPVNYMGFARKKHKSLSQEVDEWNRFFLEAMEILLDVNDEQYFEEFYTATVLRQLFGSETSGFVDYRSPANFLGDNLIIDFDGQIYPSDEARMLSRVRQVDLALGTLADGIDESKTNNLNRMALNEVHEDCIHCAYMPYCGIDVVDDISRYNRLDVIKQNTWYCGRQMFLLDFIFDKVLRQDRRWLDLFLSWIERRASSSRAYEIFG